MNDKNMKYITIINMIISICLVIAMIITGITVSKLNTKVLDIERVSGVDVLSPIVDPVGETMSGSSAEKVLNNLSTEISKWKFGNNYIPMYSVDSDDPTTILLYNSKGECISQDASTDTRTNTVYLMDGNTVYFGSDTISYGYDLDLVAQIMNVVTVAKSGYGELIDVSNTEENSEFKSYAIDIHGYDNLEKVYAVLDEDYSKDYINSLKTALLSLGEDIDTTYLNSRYLFTYSENKLVAISNYFYFGEGATGNWNSCYSNWGIEYPLEIHDWSLPDFWYNYDYDNMTDDEGTELIENMQTLTSELSAMLEEVDKENGYTSDDELNIFEDTTTESDDSDSDNTTENTTENK